MTRRALQVAPSPVGPMWRSPSHHRSDGPRTCTWLAWRANEEPEQVRCGGIVVSTLNKDTAS